MMGISRSNVPADAMTAQVTWSGIVLDVHWMAGRVEEHGWWVFPLGQETDIGDAIDAAGGQELALWSAIDSAVEAVEAGIALRSRQDADDVEHQRCVEDEDPGDMYGMRRCA